MVRDNSEIMGMLRAGVLTGLEYEKLIQELHKEGVADGTILAIKLAESLIKNSDELPTLEDYLNVLKEAAKNNDIDLTKE